MISYSGRFGRLYFLTNIYLNSRIFRILGTPTESTWPGVSSLPDYKAVFPKWEVPASTRTVLQHDLGPGGHQLLAALLTYNPDQRVSARTALKAPYLSHVSAVAPPGC